MAWVHSLLPLLIAINCHAFTAVVHEANRDGFDGDVRDEDYENKGSDSGDGAWTRPTEGKRAGWHDRESLRERHQEREDSGGGSDGELDDDVYSSGDTGGSTWMSKVEATRDAQHARIDAKQRHREEERRSRDAHLRELEQEKRDARVKAKAMHMAERMQREARRQEAEFPRAGRYGHEPGEHVQGRRRVVNELDDVEWRDSRLSAQSADHTMAPHHQTSHSRSLMRREPEPYEESRPIRGSQDFADLERTQWWGHHPASENFGRLDEKAWPEDDHKSRHSSDVDGFDPRLDEERLPKASADSNVVDAGNEADDKPARIGDSPSSDKESQRGQDGGNEDVSTLDSDSGVGEQNSGLEDSTDTVRGGVSQSGEWQGPSDIDVRGQSDANGNIESAHDGALSKSETDGAEAPRASTDVDHSDDDGSVDVAEAIVKSGTTHGEESDPSPDGNEMETIRRSPVVGATQGPGDPEAGHDNVADAAIIADVTESRGQIPRDAHDGAEEPGDGSVSGMSFLEIRENGVATRLREDGGESRLDTSLLDEAMQEIDENRDGKISPMEIAISAQRQKIPLDGRRQRQRFHASDHDRDGYLNRGELALMIGALSEVTSASAERGSEKASEKAPSPSQAAAQDNAPAPHPASYQRKIQPTQRPRIQFVKDAYGNLHVPR